ncbi:c-type cytochrome [Steroidobacter sp.]|uniref:c-type cytochrome n=1 Tax=Steroidobacter sp. TaxID=1978227 RepID=UPI001A540C43|nr:c-type cytochrome [Steroidobacter sp.]MBL8271211.1 c-type cytochrome [Steroidobacter sp.]
MSHAKAWSCVLFAIVMVAHADGTSVPEEGRVTAPVNLQVLPKTLSGASIRKLMKSYSRELGVSCSHCHVEDPQTQTMDYALDDKPNKQTARLMIAMLNDINDKHLAQLGRDPRYSVPVTCGSCHLGQSTPPEYEARE